MNYGKFCVYSKNTLLYEREALAYKLKKNGVAILTKNCLVYIDCTFNERIYDIDSLNVIAFDLFVDEVTQKVKHVLVDENNVYFYDGTTKTDTYAGVVVDVHIVGSKYLIETPDDNGYNKISNIFFLQTLNKWCVQCSLSFLIIDKACCERLASNGVKILLKTFGAWKTV